MIVLLLLFSLHACLGAGPSIVDSLLAAPPLQIDRAAYEPYVLPLSKGLTTGSADSSRRGFLLRISCSLSDGSEAYGVGEIAPLPGQPYQ